VLLAPLLQRSIAAQAFLYGANDSAATTLRSKAARASLSESTLSTTANGCAQTPRASPQECALDFPKRVV
jgi:hypothetical protein